MLLPNDPLSPIGPAISFAGRIGVQFNHYFCLVYQNTPIVTFTSQSAGSGTTSSASLKAGFADYNSLLAMVTLFHFFDIGAGPRSTSSPSPTRVASSLANGGPMPRRPPAPRRASARARTRASRSTSAASPATGRGAAGSPSASTRTRCSRAPARGSSLTAGSAPSGTEEALLAPRSSFGAGGLPRAKGARRPWRRARPRAVPRSTRRRARAAPCPTRSSSAPGRTASRRRRTSRGPGSRCSSSRRRTSPAARCARASSRSPASTTISAPRSSPSARSSPALAPLDLAGRRPRAGGTRPSTAPTPRPTAPAPPSAATSTRPRARFGADGDAWRRIARWHGAHARTGCSGRSSPRCPAVGPMLRFGPIEPAAPRARRALERARLRRGARSAPRPRGG